MAAISETLTEDTQTTAVDWPGGTGSMVVHDDLGGGTAQLQFSANNGTNWANANDVNGNTASLTSTGNILFSLPPGKVRVDLSSSTNPTAKIFVRGHFFVRGN